MIELYYAPMACSLAARIVATEARVPIALRQVEIYAKTLTDTNASYRAIAPLGLVPVLRLDDGALLTEVAAVLQYLADQAPASRLAPPWGSIARYRLIEWLGYIGTELHKKILWVQFSREMTDAARASARALAPATFDHLERQLDGRAYLLGDDFTAADAYLVWALRLARIAGLDPLAKRPALASYRARVEARPSVRDAFASEMQEAAAALARQPLPG